MSKPKVPESVESALAKFSTSASVPFKLRTYEQALDRAERAREAYEDEMDASGRPVRMWIASRLRKLAPDCWVRAHHIEVSALVDHRDWTSNAHVRVRMPMKDNGYMDVTWWAGGEESLLVWLDRTARAWTEAQPAGYRKSVSRRDAP